MLTSYMFWLCRCHLQADIWKYTDDVRKGDLTSYRFLLQVWFLHKIAFRINIDNDNYKIKINPSPANVENMVSS
jgi:hypothetical protein